LLCDGFGVRADAADRRLVLEGSDCPRAQQALASFEPGPSAAQPLVDGRAVDLANAIQAAAALLQASRQPLMAGLGADVAGSRALYALAADAGAIADAANGATLMHGLRALQDRGAYTTTLAEVRTRAELLVFVGGLPLARLPELLRRCGVGEQGLVAQRHLVLLGGDGSAPAELATLPGVTLEHLPLQGDLFDTVAVLAASVACAAVAAPALAALTQRLQASRYSVLAWEAASLPAQGALIVEALNRIVGTLNRSTRAATLPLGGGDGAATANQVWAWLSGLPLRTRVGPAGLEHEPQAFDTHRLLADGAVDSLLWVSAFGSTALPPGLRLPLIVLGHPALAAAVAAHPRSVFIPVATPGIGAAGHLFRTDGVVLMPLHAVQDDGLPTLAAVARQLRLALQALRNASAA
jgi:formylmethanofuran dehydrogenase subunit B